ncbi:unnamed protein product [Blepharisma stoltei]|uniref:Uncharacterized protein n=1 Tax=Blepharisma stoltei TaxID=1481888 RepID=A0AAU9JZX3_9CILI|nr:unnamed protein product [Blepharisma stoltei]
MNILSLESKFQQLEMWEEERDSRSRANFRNKIHYQTMSFTNLSNTKRSVGLLSRPMTTNSLIKRKSLTRLNSLETFKKPAFRQLYTGVFSNISLVYKRSEHRQILRMDGRSWKTTGSNVYKVRNQSAKNEVDFGL